MRKKARWHLPRKWQAIALFTVAMLLLVLAESLVADELLSELRNRYPPRADEMQPTKGWALPVELPAEMASQKRIPLLTDWGEADVSSAAVTFGVPLPRGLIADSTELRLFTGDGDVVPAEFQQVATWDGPDGSPRWVLVHATVERDKDYAIGYGPGLPVVPDGPLISIEERSTELHIDTGPLQAELSLTEPTLLSSVIVQGYTLVAGGEPKILPVVVDGEGTTHTARGGDKLSVEVVHAGTQQVVVRREGVYADDSGTPFCRFITYTYFYAGSATVRHDHTLIVAFDSHQHTIRAITLPLQLTLDRATDVIAAAGEQTTSGDFALASPQRPVRLQQSNPDHWALLEGDDIRLSGDRTPGWMQLSDRGGGVVVSLADFWQQAPAELEADGNLLLAHLWPPQGVGALDFAPSAQLGDAYPEDHVFHGGLYADGLDEMTQAFGLGKTHTLHFNFAVEKTLATARVLSRSQASSPVLVWADPLWVTATDVLYGRVHPYNADDFPEIEAILDSVVDHLYDQRETHGQYGWIDFGDTFNSGKLWRRWASMFYGIPNVMPRLYVRSGRRDAWDYHRANTRHITDIDICHLDSAAFNKTKGLRYGGNGGIAHYAADLYTVGPDTHVEFMLMDYYLNGNLRTWEVAQDYLLAHARQRAESSAMTSYQHRATGGALRLFSEGYQATWDPEYLSIMHQLADILYDAHKELGITRHDDVYMNPSKVLYYQLTGEERMRELFLDEMAQLADRGSMHALAASGRGATMSGLAHAYWMTGDERYLPFLLWQLDLPLEAGGPQHMSGVTVGLVSTHAQQLPEVMAVLASVETLPEPHGPAAPEAGEARPFGIQSDGATYLNETQDGPIEAQLEIRANPNHYGGFENFLHWWGRLEGEAVPVLRVLAPDGSEIERIELMPDSHRVDFELPENGLQRPKWQVKRGYVGTLDIVLPPDGQTGVYTLQLLRRGVPMSVRLADTNIPQHGNEAGPWTWASGHIQLRSFRNNTFYFPVPPSTGEFRLSLKSPLLRGTMSYAIRDAEGAVVASDSWIVGSTARDDWEVVELDGGQQQKPQVWSISFNGTPQVFLALDGVPALLASSPEAVFDPHGRLIQTPILDPAPAPAPWGGSAGLIDVSTDYEFEESQMSADEGTVEFWVRTLDTPSDLSDQPIANIGGVRLARRGRIGTYVLLPEARLHCFFRLPAGQWTHLAVTWKPSNEPDSDLEFTLFADGVPVDFDSIHASESPHKTLAANWVENSIQLFPGSQFAGLRVSDHARYNAPFTPPRETPQADDHTLLVLPAVPKPTAEPNPSQPER